uniref:Uncharacterized protein n=1 Tax=Anopheles farauti TaxID=69004 RepID=A0A182QJD9_9DIPT
MKGSFPAKCAGFGQLTTRVQGGQGKMFELRNTNRVPSNARSSMHSNVSSNWNGFRKLLGLSSTTTLVMCTFAIVAGCANVRVCLGKSVSRRRGCENLLAASGLAVAPSDAGVDRWCVSRCRWTSGVMEVAIIVLPQ